mmetsp:Transcript_25951/g.42582  ORF Transcript_25951/g.42582 Transcript_25951/m.42582 type:complete len:84 (+) Transcript_25951:330-581(+)
MLCEYFFDVLIFSEPTEVICYEVQLLAASASYKDNSLFVRFLRDDLVRSGVANLTSVLQQEFRSRSHDTVHNVLEQRTAGMDL